MHVYFCVLFIKNKVHYCILLLFTNKYTIMYNRVTRLIQSNTDKPEKLITSNHIPVTVYEEENRNSQEDD